MLRWYRNGPAERTKANDVRDAVSLSRYLREGTADVHRDAEHSAFVSRFVQGKLDKDTYTRHLLALHPVYTTLEGAMENLRDTPRLAPFYVPALWRTASLAADLQHLRGPDWKREEPVAGARRYAEHLRGLRDRAPVLLVAHCYVRYLGDLSGGQVLGKLARQHLGLDGEGTSFYEFREIADPSAFKDEYRRRLDELPLNKGEHEALLEEARRAFRLNASIFEELVGGTPR
jgi:heme oxygenase